MENNKELQSNDDEKKHLDNDIEKQMNSKKLIKLRCRSFISSLGGNKGLQRYVKKVKGIWLPSRKICMNQQLINMLSNKQPFLYQKDINKQKLPQNFEQDNKQLFNWAKNNKDILKQFPPKTKSIFKEGIIYYHIPEKSFMIGIISTIDALKYNNWSRKQTLKQFEKKNHLNYVKLNISDIDKIKSADDDIKNNELNNNDQNYIKSINPIDNQVDDNIKIYNKIQNTGDQNINSIDINNNKMEINNYNQYGASNKELCSNNKTQLNNTSIFNDVIKDQTIENNNNVKNKINIDKCQNDNDVKNNNIPLEEIKIDNDCAIKNIKLEQNNSYSEDDDQNKLKEKQEQFNIIYKNDMNKFINNITLLENIQNKYDKENEDILASTLYLIKRNLVNEYEKRNEEQFIHSSNN